MATLEEIEEGLRHLSLVPPDERGAGWHAYANSLLEQRKALVPPTPVPVLVFSE